MFEPCFIPLYDGKHVVKCKRVFAGNNHAFALTEDGKVWGWGINASRQLGFSRPIPRYDPAKVDAASQQPKLLPREQRSLMSTEEHDQYKENYRLQLEQWSASKECLDECVDQDEMIESPYIGVPTRLECPEPIQEIAAGAFHTIFLTRKGNLLACGSNACGQLGIPKVQTASPDDPKKQVCQTLRRIDIGGVDSFRFRKIGAGSDSSAAIDSRFRCWSWGWGENSRLGSGTEEEVEEPQQMCSGIVRSDGTNEEDTNWRGESIHVGCSFTMILARIEDRWLWKKQSVRPPRKKVFEAAEF